MNLSRFHPAELAIAMLSRSQCSVMVGACLADSWGVYAWGWNSAGSGFGEHAEAHCLRRSNRKRWAESILFVAARRRKSGNTISAKPCPDCQRLISKIGCVMYRDREGWHRL